MLLSIVNKILDKYIFFQDWDERIMMLNATIYRFIYKKSYDILSSTPIISIFSGERKVGKISF